MMKKVALLFVLLASTLFGCSSVFTSCIKKVQDTNVVRGDALYIPVSKQTVLVYSKKPLQNALKSDMFLHLYLINAPKQTPYPFKLNRYLPSKELIAVGKTSTCTKIIANQNALEYFGRLKNPPKNPAVVLNGCCELVAIATPKGAIDKKYIAHFLQNGGEYGSFGARFVVCQNNITVSTVNPFVQTPLQVGDIIQKVDGKKITSLFSLQNLIALSKPKQKYKVQIKRCKKVHTFTITTLKRSGGGFLSDSYLESLGIYLDNDLHVIRSQNKNIKIGDTVVIVNNKKVTSSKEIQKALQGTKGSLLLGINRNGLVFFVPIKWKN